MVKILLELFSIFDWVSPSIGAAKDFKNLATGLRPTFAISVDKGDLNRAQDVIKRAGYSVISTTQVAFDDEAFINVEQYGGVDGYDSIRWIMDKLQRAGIDTWVTPRWA